MGTAGEALACRSEQATLGSVMVEAGGLVKRYGDVVALAGLDLDVAEGTVLGLLGANGAGKTFPMPLRIFAEWAGPRRHVRGEVVITRWEAPSCS